MTYRFDLLREGDITGLLRLVGEVTELPPDNVARRTHVLHGLLSLVGGRSAVALEMAAPAEGPFARPGTIVNVNYGTESEARQSEMYLVHNNPADPVLPGFLAARGQTLTMTRDVVDATYHRTDHFNIVRRPFDIDHSLYCRLTLPSGDDLAVGLQRSLGDPVFTEPDKALVHLLHTSAPHVYAAPRQRPPELDQLAPRLRPVLRYLLQGDAEKEVAAKLNLSRHTVHRYAQAIYQALNVHTRGELLAKYARQG
jgi:DNA-binding CsgD family transcriptional regulator